MTNIEPDAPVETSALVPAGLEAEVVTADEGPWILTFGSGHHPAGFPQAQMNGYVIIDAPDYLSARLHVIGRIGTEWSDLGALNETIAYAIRTWGSMAALFPLGELDRWTAPQHDVESV